LFDDYQRLTKSLLDISRVPDPIFRNLARQRLVSINEEAAQVRCDGLFLPAVDNLGIRVPVAEISEAIRQQSQLHFVATDAAQAIGHVPLLNDLAASDLVIAGTHKWLGGYLPLGLAFLCNEQTRKEIVETSERMRANEDLDDPLLDFLTDMEFGSLRTHTETVNLTPLMTCCGALQDFTCPNGRVEMSLRQQLTNAEAIRTLAEVNGWKPMLSVTDQRTGIVLLQCVRPSIQSLSAEALRHRMQQVRFAATAYEGGIIRLSMPRTVLEPESLQRIGSTLQQLSADHNHRTVINGYVPADHTAIAAC
jgi:selenocysteine lyase/cysteine desulfurase